MKKIFLSAAVILGGLSAFASSTIEMNQSDEIVFAVQEEYKEVKAEDLPQAVKDALAADFETATLTKASVNEKEEYKLDVSVEGNAYSIYADKDGNWLEK